jgi:hypothetical protein
MKLSEVWMSEAALTSLEMGESFVVNSRQVFPTDQKYVIDVRHADDPVHSCPDCADNEEGVMDTNTIIQTEQYQSLLLDRDRWFKLAFDLADKYYKATGERLRMLDMIDTIIEEEKPCHTKTGG